MARLTGSERRRKGRLKLPQTVRVRPSDPHLHDFDEILPTLNASRDSVYFASKNVSYTQGMRLFVTYTYSDAPGSLNREYLGKECSVSQPFCAGLASARLRCWRRRAGRKARRRLDCLFST